MSRRAAQAALLLALALGSLLAARAWLSPGSLPALADSVIVIPRGSSPPRIASQLRQAGVLGSPRAFLWGVRLSGSAPSLRAGRYRFERPMAPAAVLDLLRGGRTEKIRLTVPEGLWLGETLGLIADELGLDSLGLARLAADRSIWPHPFLAGSGNLEGFLFPDTYLLEYPTDEKAVLDAMLRRFSEVYSDLASACRSEGMGVRELVTLASIVEAEARLDSERPRIAAVYRNRLRRGMKLEADPTVLYAIGRRKKRVYDKDLAFDSPYNTYRNVGLPPGPICSPGQRCLEAVLAADPAEKSLYFVADGQGGHLFSETYREHLRKVRALRRGPRP